MVLVGQVRSLKSLVKGTKGTYLEEGLVIMIDLQYRKHLLFSVVPARVNHLEASDDGCQNVADKWLPNCHRTLGPATGR